MFAQGGNGHGTIWQPGDSPSFFSQLQSLFLHSHIQPAVGPNGHWSMHWASDPHVFGFRVCVGVGVFVGVLVCVRVGVEVGVRDGPVGVGL